MKILTSHSVDTLRIECFQNPGTILDSFDSIVGKFGLETVEYPLDVDETVVRKLSCNFSEKFAGDVANVAIVRKAFAGLDALAATDERVWVSLLLTHATDYARDRWWDPKVSHQSKVSAVSNHWFATSSRGFIRDHAISRLWWLGEYTESLDAIDSSLALEVLFWNSDLQSQFLGRPTVMSSRKIGDSILRVMKEVKDQGDVYDRDKFRRLCSSVDLKLGRQLLLGLGHQQLDLEVRAIATKLYPLP